MVSAASRIAPIVNDIIPIAKSFPFNLIGGSSDFIKILARSKAVIKHDTSMKISNNKA